MAEFTDESGRQWQLRIDVNTIRRVRQETGYDLAVMFSAEGLDKLLADVVCLVDVLESLCRGQIETRKLTAEDFAAGLYGAAIESAVNALVEAGIDFLPPARQAAVRQMWAKLLELGRAQEAKVLERLASLDLQTIGGDPPGSSGPA